MADERKTSSELEINARFNEVIGTFDPAMVIVTTCAGGERAGCLVGFHAQSSIVPVRYVVWLSKANHTCRVALRADVLAVHALGRSNRAIAELFGTMSGDDVDKFARCGWEAGPDGVPLLGDCPNRFVGRRVATVDEGSDHIAFFVEPIDATSVGPVDPLRMSAVAGLSAGHDPTDRPG